MPSREKDSEHSIVHMTSVAGVGISDVQNDYSKNFAKYYAYACLLTPSKTAAEDLVQQAFLNVIDVLEKGNTIQEDTLHAYVKKIIRNLSISHHKKESVQPLLRIVESHYPSPETQYVLSTDQDIVTQAISQLSNTQRAIVVMHYFDGLKVREIAEELDISVGTAKTHLQRARHNIEVAINANRLFPTQE